MNIKYLDKKTAKVTVDFSALRAIDSAFTFDDAEISDAADTITIAGHPYKTGDQVGSVLTAATGVTATVPNATINVAYWVIYVDKDTISLATSLALAKAGTATPLTAGGATVDQFLQRESFGALGTGLVIPNNAIITNCWINIETTCKSWDGAWGAGNEDAATLALSIEGANDLVSAISIATGTIWDASVAGTLAGSGTTTLTEAGPNTRTTVVHAADRAAGVIKLTADRELTLTIAVDAVSQGKMDIYVDYYVQA